MSRDTDRDQTASILAVAIAAGLLSGATIIFTLSAVGLPLLEASVFGVLSGFTLGAFLHRERSLTHSNECSRIGHRLEVARLEQCIQYYYENSLACLAEFDAGTLLIGKVSPGFLQLLRIPPDLEVRGKSIVEMLRVTSSSVEGIVSEAQREINDAPHHRLLVEDSQGNQLSLEITAKYYKESHLVEAAFFVSPFSGRENVEEADVARDDLDRFRRGMYRRETRILELKEEVNKILMESGEAPRYRFAQRTQDTHTPLLRKTDREETP